MAKNLKEVIAQYEGCDLVSQAKELKDWLSKHPEIPEELPTTTTDKQESPEDALLRVRYEYATKPHTPEFIQESWQTMYGAWVAIAKREDPTFDMTLPIVPDCGRTQEQLKDLEADEKGRVYVAPMSYEMFAKLFPAMRSDNAARGRISDDVKVEGWYDFDMSIDAPHLGITESGLRANAVDGWEVAAGKTYIAATNGSKVFVDRYLDQGNANGENWTWSLLLSSRVGGGVVGARSDPDGRVGFIPDFVPGVPVHDRGGRLQRK